MIIPAKYFYMLRHGQSEANIQEVMSGSRDVALTDLGRQQAENAIAAFMALKQKPSVIIHSHRQRARETATIINRVLGLEMIEDPRLAEQNFGDWEGQSVPLVRPFILRGDNPPNGETNQEFYTRFGNALNDHLTISDAPALFVGHGGLWRAFGSFYGQQMPKPSNAQPYCFAPSQENKEFPWAITEAKTGGFKNAPVPS